MKKSMKQMEKKETPKQEAMSHKPQFLSKALKLSRKQAAKIRSAAGAAY